MRFENYLTEALMKINPKDIDTIYKYLKPWVTEINKNIDDIIYNKTDNLTTTINKIYKLPKTIVGLVSVYTIKNIPSLKLFTNKSMKKANIIRPLNVVIGFSDEGYCAYNSNEDTLIISLEITALEETLESYTNNRGYEIDDGLLDILYSKDGIKGKITHEITHWLDDVNHDLYLSKILSNSKRATNYIKKYGTRESSPAEIQAIVHEFNYLRNAWKFWDDITFDDLIDIMGWDIDKNTRKAILKRMYREKLLGKKMK